MSSPPNQIIPGNRFLEEIGRLHVQLAMAQEAIRDLQAQNAQLAKELRDALAHTAELEASAKAEPEKAQSIASN